MAAGFRVSARALLKAFAAAALPLLALSLPAHAQSEYASDPFNPIVARDAWALISEAEKANNIPPGLLHAMSLVETGQGIRGWVLPWPYTVGVNAPQSKTFTSKAQAQGALSQWRKWGFVRFDVRVPGSNRTGLSGAAASQVLAAQPETVIVVMKPHHYGRRFNNAVEAEAFISRMFAMGYNNMDIGMMQINWRVHGKKFANVRAALEPNANLAYAVNYLLTHRQTYDWWGAVGRYHSGTAVYANRYIKNVYAMYLRIHRVNNNA